MEMKPCTGDCLTDGLVSEGRRNWVPSGGGARDLRTIGIGSGCCYARFGPLEHVLSETLTES
jgi:hypothetical protein